MTKFTDATEMAKKYPQTFQAPSGAELDSLRVGDFIKVCAEVGLTGERFWCIINRIEGDAIKAEVNNDLVLVEDFNCGDVIEVRKCNIYDILR